MVRSVFGGRGDGMSVASLGILGKDSNIEKSVHPGSGQDYFRRLWWRRTLGETMPN